jgi:YgiT-type zinc finger domain-containing protein
MSERGITERDVREILSVGETRPGTATVTVKHNSTVLVIKGVPADICANCGEEYVGEATTAHLLRTAEEVSRAGVEVDVREYVGP